jgi:hypothetical protein
VEAVLCFVAAHLVPGTLLAPRCFNEDLINMFLVCTKATFVFSHTRRAKARVPDMHTAEAAVDLIPPLSTRFFIISLHLHFA